MVRARTERVPLSIVNIFDLPIGRVEMLRNQRLVAVQINWHE